MALAGSQSRVLVVDDDPGILDAVSRALARDGHHVKTASGGEEALRTAATWVPDVAVLDILMPGLDGIEVCKRLRMQLPALGILFLTAKDGESDELTGLGVGADDYIVKPFSVAVLRARINALERRRDLGRGESPIFADLRLDTARRIAQRGAREIVLTTMEYRLLLQFMRAPDQVLPKEDLTQRVWGYDFDGNYNVLEVYVSRLRQKLEAGGEPRLLYTMRRSGYVLRQPLA